MTSSNYHYFGGPLSPSFISHKLLSPFQQLSAIFLLVVVLVLSPNTCMANKAPVLRLSLSLNKGGNTVHPREDTNVNSLLAVLRIEDRDVGLDGEVLCQSDNSYIVLETTSPNMYIVNLQRHLDRERESSFDVEIICKDFGSPPMASKANFHVVVEDINDNAPVFPKDFYEVEVEENEPAQRKLDINLRAMDHDVGDNAAIEYTLINADGKDTDLFEINPDNGDIYTLTALDYEEARTITLLVTAIDFGVPSLSSSATLMVKVIDKNDNSPLIEAQEFEITEGEKPMSEVGKIKATDSDSGDNGKIIYTIVEDENAGITLPFIVEQETGMILTSIALDREINDSYTFRVKVTDQGMPPLSNSSFITIKVTDINDHPPKILQPRPDDDSDYGLAIDNLGDLINNNTGNLVIDWYCPRRNDGILYRVLATDKDDGENSRITYSLPFINDVPFSEDSLFKIDPESGEIRLQRCVRQHEWPPQTLTVACSDNGEPSLKAFIKMNVTIDVDFDAITKPHTTTVRTKSWISSVDVDEGNSSDPSSSTQLAVSLSFIIFALFSSLNLFSFCREHIFGL